MIALGVFLLMTIALAFWRSVVGATLWIVSFVGLTLAGLVGSSVTLTASGFMVPPPWPW
jgi:hypothetical protein